MTLPDLGPERPGQASDTRQMVEQDRAHAPDGHVSNPVFVIALVVIVLAIVIAFLLAR